MDVAAVEQQLQQEALDIIKGLNGDLSKIVKDGLPEKMSIGPQEFEFDLNELAVSQYQGGVKIERLRDIKQVLNLIKKNEFGICRDCNQEVPDKRLEATDYAATTCFSCATEREAKMKGGS